MADRKRRRLYDNYEYVGEVLKAPNIKLIVSLVSQKGVKSVNIREFFRRGSDPEWMPNGKGMTIPVRIPIDNIVRTPSAEIYLLVSKALKMAPNFPLQGEDVWIYLDEENKF